VLTSGANAWITLLVFMSAFFVYLALTGRFPSGFRVMLFLFYTIQMWLVSVGFSLATSVLYLRYRDLTHLWDAASQAGFFVAPIVFPMDIMPERLHFYMYMWPPTPVIQYARQVLIDATVPSLRANLYLLGVTLAVLAIGIVVFRRYAPRAAEHL